MDARKVCVVGLGYIGLPTASLLATKGHTVLGVDIDPHVVSTINQGDIHIVEPDLDLLVRSAVGSGKLSAATTPGPADVFILAVPTPFGSGHQPDLSYVIAATEAIAPHVQSGDLVILESTSPVGTTEQVAATLYARRPELEGHVHLAHCPERVLPGHILRELVENDRVVGGLDPASTTAAVAFYRGFVNGEVIATDARSAELTKLVENSYRDVNIAFANELSMICGELDIDVREVISMANRHPRVNILSPGPGVGGHCIAVDPWFIVSSAPETARLIRTSREVNTRKAEWVIEQVHRAAAGLSNPKVACLGLAYKPDIDDLRESPALHITKRLRESYEVLAVDPHVQRFDAFPLTPLDQALAEADLIVVLVAHKAFKRVPRERFAGKPILDTCGALT